MQLLQIFYILLISLFPNLNVGPGDGKAEGSIIIDNGNLTINGTSIDAEWKYIGFKTALGKPEIEDGRTETHESKGIVVWKEGENYNEVTEFKVNFLPDAEKYWITKKYYTGTISIEGVSIAVNTSVEKLKTDLPQYNWQKNSATGWYEGIYKKVFMYIQYDSKEKNIIWIDLGLDDDNTWN